jgi:gliding motility-associated-like protein
MNRRIKIFLILLLLFPVLVSAQYLENPSFEGAPGIAHHPPGWIPFHPQSTPDTEPLNCDYFNASNGDTYLTLIAHGSESSLPGINENCQATLNKPLLKSFCYTLSMDLASRNDLGHYIWGEGFILYGAAVYLKIFGSNSSSDRGVLLAETERVTNVIWENISFTIKPDNDIYYLLLEVAFENAGAKNGNILIDNMILSDFKMESTVALNEIFSTSDLPITIEASENATYSWSPSADLSCYDCRSPQVLSDISRTYSCLISSSSTACPNLELFILSFEEIIELPTDFKIPNVFTPNGDGTNDHFEILGLPLYSTLLVYDRSGREIFSSKAYKDEWDGSDMDGNLLPQDNYWYVLIIPGLNEKQKGSVYLKRD